MATGGITVKVLGFKILEQNIVAVNKALEDAAPAAVEKASAIPIQLMKRLVPKKTQALERSIRFTFGKGGGAARISKAPSGRGSKGLGKARVIGYIMAGDRTTIVGGIRKGSKKRGFGKGKPWQNAFLQEFGTVKMKANPFFFPAWRATRRQFKASIIKDLRVILRTAKKQQIADQRAAARAAKLAA